MLQFPWTVNVIYNICMHTPAKKETDIQNVSNEYNHNTDNCVMYYFLKW